MSPNNCRPCPAGKIAAPIVYVLKPTLYFVCCSPPQSASLVRFALSFSITTTSEQAVQKEVQPPEAHALDVLSANLSVLLRSYQRLLLLDDEFFEQTL